MNEKRKLKFKKFYFHPVTTFMVMSVGVVILSWILSIFQAQATYNVVNVNTKELEPALVTVENLLSCSFRNINNIFIRINYWRRFRIYRNINKKTFK